MKIKESIYLDHQASTPVDRRILAKMEPYWREDFGNPHSSEHALGWSADSAITSAKDSIAKLIGADGDEIIFTSGATESNNLALFGVARHSASGSKRRRILVSSIEHKCVLAAATSLRNDFGFFVELIPVDENGEIDLGKLNELIDDDVIIVSVIHANNEIGSIQDIHKISEITNKYGALLHCDSAQAPCAIDIDVFSQNIDLLSLSGHKMYAPKGIGVLYIRRALKTQIEPIIYGGGQQDNIRSGTLPVPLCVGMGAAAELIMEEGKLERERVRCLRDRLVSLLQSSSWPIRVNGPSLENRHPGNANLQFEGFSGQDIIAALQPRLLASTGSACTSGIPEPSHVLKAIGLTTEAADSSIRLSVGRETTSDDIEDAVRLILETLNKLSETAIAI